MPITVTELQLAPVKGMRVVAADALELGPTGAVGDRALVVVDGDELMLSSRTPALMQIVPDWDPATATLALRFPDGSVVEEVVEPGEPLTTHNYEGRELTGRRVDGALAAAVSEHLGRRVTLARLDDGVRGPDDAPVTLMATASLGALAPELGGTVPDPRRFRMTLTIDGVDAWEEHGWTDRELAVGDARLRVIDPVVRCVITTRDPDRGTRDLPVLKALATLHGKQHVEFGVWCDVVAPGTVRRGDAVTLG